MADETNFAGQRDEAQALADVMEDLERRSQRFGSALTSALQAATTGGKGLDGVLQGLGTRLSNIALSAGLKPLENMLSSAVSSLTSGAGSLFAFANGGVPGRVTPFAEGGVVSSPTFFPMGSDMGLMGEAGSEAILPLKRGADGSLGVASAGGGGGTQIVFNVTASDAASFRRSEGQISAMLARSVGRGQRGL
ncbi:phage tail tape measure protein [Agrobacterium rosae]|uniref:Phage tail protein n=1 Tax=Agrobacterium rosae TaxID=1972867 RepID=A0AAE5RXX6_9HYPH|nr:phage tail tape measure protein [Agrobacterium rosae]KAA3514411.1 phage tail tape measure protein [Agrobacterium rosae]KAA3523077.1 phage tail tape measure protein [Agrobacterium rosae]MDX8329831.1 phage tail tape measure protein [Agrobacterium rosae]MQB47793.1 phage tail tape measure protein [Agrobacterium rosae]POO51465.1 phage tail protein [Agrobacterium rosae]